MAQFPAMPLWTDAYLADTGHLTTLEHGAYLLLLMSMWRSGGHLPNDDRKLARFARVTNGQWRRIRPTIMEFFTETSDGRITQGRLTDELTLVRQKIKSQSNNSRARWLKNKETRDPMGSNRDSDGNPPTTTTTTTIKNPPIPPKGGGASDDQYPEAFERLWEARPRRAGNDPKPKAFQAWKARIREGRITEEDAHAKVVAYRRFCEVTGKLGTETVMQLASFFGPKNEAYLQDWALPKTSGGAVAKLGMAEPAPREKFELTQEQLEQQQRIMEKW